MISILKNNVRNMLAGRGWELTRRTAHNGPQLDFASIAIEHCILSGHKGAILQVGANDGVLTDPVQALIKKHNVAALLVEPLPNLYEKLVANYSGSPNVQFANVAISTAPGEATIYRIDPNAPNMPDWIHGTATFDRSVLMKHIDAPGVPKDIYEQSIQDVRVPVVTVKQLLSKHSNLDEIFAVAIDTEGHDFEVIRSVIAAGIKPKVISYEHKHLSYDDQVECRSILSDLGFRFMSHDDDTVACC
jgi:FkbM family methyltransferase